MLVANTVSMIPVESEHDDDTLKTLLHTPPTQDETGMGTEPQLILDIESKSVSYTHLTLPTIYSV